MTAILSSSPLTQSLAKAFTMAVINPWAYYTPAEAVSEIAVRVAQKASVYLAQALERHFRGVSVGGGGQNVATELSQQAFQIGELLIEQRLADNVAKYYLFRLNPGKLSKSFSKIRDNRLTGAGPVQNTYGNQLIGYTYNGTMGSMRPALGVVKLPQVTAAWHYLQLFEQFYLRHDDDLIFILDDEVVIGRFDSMNYDLDADRPWLINYRFSITVYPDTKFSLLSGGVGQAFQVIKPAPVRMAFNTRPLSSNIDVFEDVYGQQFLQTLSTPRIV